MKPLSPLSGLIPLSRCFTQNELQTFSNFVAQNPTNFPGAKQYVICDENEEFPYCGGPTLGLARNRRQNIRMPKYLILRQQPYHNTRGDIFNCMDVTLVTNGQDNHTYALEFDVIGRIETI